MILKVNELLNYECPDELDSNRLTDSILSKLYDYQSVLAPVFFHEEDHR
jgi:hypothetical protein